MLFVQFRCLTFTCEVCDSFGSPVGGRRSDRRGPVRSRGGDNCPLPPRIRVTQGSRCGASGQRFLRDFSASERNSERSRCTDGLEREEGGGARRAFRWQSRSHRTGWLADHQLVDVSMIRVRLISMRPESPAAAWGAPIGEVSEPAERLTLRPGEDELKERRELPAWSTFHGHDTQPLSAWIKGRWWGFCAGRSLAASQWERGSSGTVTVEREGWPGTPYSCPISSRSSTRPPWSPGEARPTSRRRGRREAASPAASCCWTAGTWWWIYLWVLGSWLLSTKWGWPDRVGRVWPQGLRGVILGLVSRPTLYALWS